MKKMGLQSAVKMAARLKAKAAAKPKAKAVSAPATDSAATPAAPVGEDEAACAAMPKLKPGQLCRVVDDGLKTCGSDGAVMKHEACTVMLAMKGGTVLKLLEHQVCSNDDFSVHSKIPWSKFQEAVKRQFLSSPELQFHKTVRPAADRLDAIADLVKTGAALMAVEAVHLWAMFLEWALLTGGAAEGKMVFLHPEEVRMEHEPFLERMTGKLKNVQVIAAPICAAGHWCLLILEGPTGSVQVMDSLSGDEMSPACVNTMRNVMFNCAGVESWSWIIPHLETELHRDNRQRQDPMQCGYFVCHWLENVARQVRWEGPWSLGRCHVGTVRQKMMKLMEHLLPVEKKLQKSLEDIKNKPKPKSSSGGAASSSGGSTPAPACVAAAMVGVDMPVPLSDFGGDVEAWAQSVVGLLTEEHRALCDKVGEKELKESKSCARCEYSEEGCSSCCFWKAVRYWRNIEVQGKLCEAYAPGQVKAAKMQAKTFLK